MVSVQLSTRALNCTISWSLVHFVMQCTRVSQFFRLGCVMYVTALEAYWCTEASAALLLSFVRATAVYMFPCLKVVASWFDMNSVILYSRKLCECIFS